VFSLYAEGIVPGRHRETRVRMHTVVDFRSANELGATTDGQDDDSSQQQQPSTSPDQLTPEQLVGALASDPMGVIIYHRIE
jgi:hypothetical protein